AGLQNSQYFLERPLLIWHATEYKSADDCVGAAVRNGQVVRSPASQLDLHSQAGRLFFEISVHKGIGLDANPLNAIFGKILEVGACAWSNLQHGTRKSLKELALVARHKPLIFGIQMGQSPCKSALPPRGHSCKSDGESALIGHRPSPAP